MRIEMPEISHCFQHPYSSRKKRLVSGGVRAGGHHVAGLLALVADTVLLARAVAGQVADLAAVVALLALGAVAREMTVATARVAGLSTAAGTERSAGTSISTVRLALAGDVANLSALVALSGARAITETDLRGAGVVAIAGDMAGLATLVAGLLLGGLGAFTAHVSVQSTVVAGRSSTLGAFTGLRRKRSWLASSEPRDNASCSLT